jgi:hypothetical protein
MARAFPISAPISQKQFNRARAPVEDKRNAGQTRFLLRTLYSIASVLIQECQALLEPPWKIRGTQESNEKNSNSTESGKATSDLSRTKRTRLFSHLRSNEHQTHSVIVSKKNANFFTQTVLNSTTLQALDSREINFFPWPT